MSVSRRRFLRSSAVLSAAALVLKPSSLILGQDLYSNGALAFNSKTRASCYTRAMFEPYIGDTFYVRVGRQKVELKLEALTNLNQASSGITTGTADRTDCFSMLFRASTPLPSTATTHTLDHRALGSFDLFMIQSEKGTKFLNTAIVNHIA